MAGRPPAPIRVLQQSGKKHLTKAEIEKRIAAEDSLKPAANNIKCPAWLDDVAKKEWKRIINELKRLELVTNLDIASLAVCCDAYSKYIKATTDINKVGLIVSYTNKSGNKNIVQYPLINVATKYSEIYKKYCNDFGLTPSSRIKLAINKEVDEKPVNKFEKFSSVNNG